jgi:signal peptide peptidase SppA
MTMIRESYLQEYFGAWACHELDRLVSALDLSDLPNHIQSNSDHEIYAGAGGYEVVDGVAIIQLRGPMMKHSSSLSANASTIATRRAISNAEADDEVDSIMFMIDSPGGTVSGTQDLASRVAKTTKPTVAFIEDLGASAAYWVASQCDEIVANAETALIGSIGTYSVVYDSSEAAEKEGVKVHVIRSSELKGSGVPGSEVTDEMIADYRRVIDALNEQFLKAVADGRGVSIERVRGWADGRVHPAEEALRLGLIDRIEAGGVVLSGMQNSFTRSHLMANENKEELVAPVEDVKDEEVKVEDVKVEDVKVEDVKAEDVKAEDETSDPVAEAREQTLAEISEYVEVFGEVQGLAWYTQGLSFEEAQGEYINSLEAQINRLETELRSSKAGSETPVSTGDEGKKTGGSGMASRIRIK